MIKDIQSSGSSGDDLSRRSNFRRSHLWNLRWGNHQYSACGPLGAVADDQDSSGAEQQHDCDNLQTVDEVRTSELSCCSQQLW